MFSAYCKPDWAYGAGTRECEESTVTECQKSLLQRRSVHVT